MARTTNPSSQLAKLRKQIAALEQKEKAQKEQKHDKALKLIVKIIKDSGLEMEAVEKALGQSSKGKRASGTTVKKTADKRAKVAPKYRNPSNHAETWTGRGKMPKWVAALKGEGKLETALIAA